MMLIGVEFLQSQIAQGGFLAKLVLNEKGAIFFPPINSIAIKKRRALPTQMNQPATHWRRCFRRERSKSAIIAISVSSASAKLSKRC